MSDEIVQEYPVSVVRGFRERAETAESRTDALMAHHIAEYKAAAELAEQSRDEAVALLRALLKAEDESYEESRREPVNIVAMVGTVNVLIAEKESARAFLASFPQGGEE